MRRLLICLALLVFLPGTVRALADDPQPVSSAMTVAEDPVPVPQPSPKAVQFYRGGNWLWLVDLTVDLVIPGLFVLSGLSTRLRNVCWRIGRRWWFAVTLFGLAYLLIVSLLMLPLAIYGGYLRLHEYGLSNQSFAHWSENAFKRMLVSMTLVVLFLWVPYWLARHSPRWWWLYAGILAVPYLYFMAFLEPIWYSPLFNTFGPMKNQVLERKILALAERAGIEGSRVFEVDKSRDTNAVNAYVTGFLGTKRIVLWDTIIAQLNQDELLVVMGHEMGHYVLGHVIRGLAFGCVLLFIALYFIHRVGGWILTHNAQNLGIEGLGDVASLPLVILLGQIMSLALLPLGMAFSRYQEHEADRFALEITHSNHAGATAFVKFLDQNLGYPRPGLLFRTWRSSHPSTAERIEFCNRYRPWTTGAPERYRPLFKGEGGVGSSP